MEDLKKLDEILDIMYPRRYRSVEYSYTTDHNDEVHPMYRCYVEGFPYGRGATIIAAIADMTKDGEGPK